MNLLDRRSLIVAAVAMLLGGCATAQGNWPAPNPQETGNTMSWKAHCVGRVMMSLPEDRPLTWSTDFDFAEVKRIPSLSEQQFWDGVEVVRQRHLAQKHEKTPTRLAHFEKVGSNAAFVFYYDNEASFIGPILERFVYLDRDHAYEMHTGGVSTANVAPTPDLFRPFVEKYSSILSRIHPLAPGKFPSRDGLCIDSAVVSGETGRNAKAGLISEIAYGTELVVSYRENLYKVSIYNGYEDIKYDENRAKIMLVDGGPEDFKDFKVLQKRDRTLAGLAGQETVARTTLNNGHTYYSMQWTIKGALDGGVLKPGIVVHLNTPQTATDTTGKPYDKLPPESELLKLWDYALSTFQWRSGALPDGQQIQAVN